MRIVTAEIGSKDEGKEVKRLLEGGDGFTEWDEVLWNRRSKEGKPRRSEGTESEIQCQFRFPNPTSDSDI